MTERFPDFEEETDSIRGSTHVEEDGYFVPKHAESAGSPAARLSPEGAVPGTPTTEQPPSRAVVCHRKPSQPSSPGKNHLEDAAGRVRSPNDPLYPLYPPQRHWVRFQPLRKARHVRLGNAGLRPLSGLQRLAVQNTTQSQALDDDCYDSKIVDLLDVIDPEVSALSSITNVQNSLFVPSLGRWVDRRPAYDLTQLPPTPGALSGRKTDTAAAESPTAGQQTSESRSPSLASVLSQPQYAILPDNASLEGWSEEDIRALNDYVRHMLHSRRSKIKQRLKAFGKYVRRPLGFLVTLYATLVTLFGLAWVLFLIGWIYVGDRQYFAIQVIDYVLVGLFGIVGDGLAPFRAIDTYHMIFVAHYHRKTWKMRKKLLLPELKDRNDLPMARTDEQPDRDVEAQHRQQDKEKDAFFPVLSEKEQSRLEHHQAKLAKSHTFYKPHETETHHAFPLRLLIAIILLLDLHSCLQISLGVCTWAVSAHRFPATVTTTILCCSIATNITAGALIMIGDRRTRKRDVLERILKQDLTCEYYENNEHGGGFLRPEASQAVADAESEE
ncbi:hypothetical protein VTH06DRAFT_3959 [Thermothelomyces fergusii]